MSARRPAQIETLQSSENLNSDEAVAWLKSQGIHTSRSGLDLARKAGRLEWLDVRGRTRILYKRAALAAAFFEGLKSCPSSSPAATKTRISTSGAVLPDVAYIKALTLATGGSRKR